MKSNFLKPNNPILYQKSKAVDKKDLQSKWFLDIVESMKDAAGVFQHGENKEVMVGLAAPQLGFAIQLVFIDLAAGAKRDGKFGNNLFIVNPKIIEKSIKKIKCNEGCYSARVEKFTIYGVVSRSEKVKVQYMALDGKNKTQTFSGFTSVVAQHEIDHLNGKIFIHRIRGKNKLEAITQNGSEKESIIMDSEFYWKQVAQIKK